MILKSTHCLNPDYRAPGNTLIWHILSLQMVRPVRSASTASSTPHGIRVSMTWRPSGCCRLPLSCETSPLRRPMSSCWRPTERACASFCSVPTVTSSHSDSLDLTLWAMWLPRLVSHYILIYSYYSSTVFNFFSHGFERIKEKCQMGVI